MEPTQILAFITGVGYVVLAAREQLSCWIFGIASCALIAWNDFTSLNLYADGVLQLVYIVLGFVGLYQWKFGQRDKTGLAIAEIPASSHLGLWTAGLLLSIPLAWLLNRYTDAAYGYVDTATTIMSLIATWLLVRKVLGNWIYWIIIDAVYVFLFYSRGADAIALLYLVFLIVAGYGYFQWRKKYRGLY